MRILVYYVSAETGGAKTILDHYYNSSIGNRNNYLFVTGKISYQEKANIQVKSYKWIKNSIFHRILFEVMVLPRIVNSFKPDKILSLQNLGLFFVEKRIQEIYIHQAIPFYSHRFNFVLEPKLWFYSRIYIILLSLFVFNTKKLIVQTSIMKRLVIKKFKIDSNRIKIEFPNFLIKDFNFQNADSIEFNKYTLIYPADCSSYKNHYLLIKSLHELNNINESPINLIFTFSKDDNHFSRKVSQYIRKHKLKVQLIGKIHREQVLYLIKRTSLLFASSIETIGLPLIEAIKLNRIILSLNTDFSSFILKKYSKVSFFNYNSKSLVEVFRSFEDTINDEIQLKNII